MDRIDAYFFVEERHDYSWVWHDASGHVPNVGDFLVGPGPHRRKFEIIRRVWSRSRNSQEATLRVDLTMKKVEDS